MAKKRINDITEDTLQSLTVPSVSMRSHQAQLRHALLAASRPDRSAKPTITTVWRETFMRNNKLIIPGAIVGLAVVAVLAFSIFGGQTQDAYAAQLVAQGVKNISQLSPGQQQVLNQHLNGSNALSDLREAERAKDLTVLTYAQLIKQEPTINLGDIKVPAATGSGWVDISSLKFLHYSDAQGKVHVIGVTSQGLPVLEIAFPAGSGSKPTISSQTQAANSQNTTTTATNGSAATQSSTSTTNSNSSTPSKSTPTPAPTSSPSTTPAAPAETPQSVLTSIIANLENGISAQVTATNVALPGPIGTAQGRPIVFTANGQTYFAYTQGQKPNFNMSPSQTASTMAIHQVTASDAGYSLTSAYLDKGNNLVDPNYTAVGYATGGN